MYIYKIVDVRRCIVVYTRMPSTDIWCIIQIDFRDSIRRPESKYVWHDDVIKWKHFPRYLPFVRGIHR